MTQYSLSVYNAICTVTIDMESTQEMVAEAVGGGGLFHHFQVYKLLCSVPHTPRYEGSPEHVVTDIRPKHLHQLQVEVDRFDGCPEEVCQHEVLQDGRRGEAEPEDAGVGGSLLGHQEGGVEAQQREAHVEEHLTKHPRT